EDQVDEYAPYEVVWNEVQLIGRWDRETYPAECCFRFPHGFLLLSPGGYGKTALIEGMIKELKGMYGESAVAICAFTGVACSMVQGAQTLHSLFKVGAGESFKVSKQALKQMAKKLKYIFVDEISMV